MTILLRPIHILEEHLICPLGAYIGAQAPKLLGFTSSHWKRGRLTPLEKKSFTLFHSLTSSLTTHKPSKAHQIALAQKIANSTLPSPPETFLSDTIPTLVNPSTPKLRKRTNPTRERIYTLLLTLTSSQATRWSLRLLGIYLLPCSLSMRATLFTTYALYRYINHHSRPFSPRLISTLTHAAKEIDPQNHAIFEKALRSSSLPLFSHFHKTPGPS